MQKLALNLKPESFDRHNLAHLIKNLSLICLLTILSIAFSGLSSSAQEVKEMRTMLSSMNASSDATVNQQASHIKTLVYDLHPSITIREGIVSTFAEAPFECIDIDIQSLDKLKESNPIFTQAELLTIRIDNQSDLKMSLDLTNLMKFANLKYINILCSIDCTSEQVSRLIKISDSKIIIFYLVSIPS
jgi:hypothetical protein